MRYLRVKGRLLIVGDAVWKEGSDYQKLTPDFRNVTLPSFNYFTLLKIPQTLLKYNSNKSYS